VNERILVVDDEPAIVDAVSYALEGEGYEVASRADGEAALAAALAEPFDLVVLDLMLPKMSGTEVCRRVRAESDVPIVMLTAKDAEVDRVLGLEIGADDYVTKPFSVRELVSRVRAHLRREEMTGGTQSSSMFSGGPVELDPSRHEVRVRGELVAVPPKEFALLEMLLRLKGRLLTRDHLIAEVWGSDYFGDTKTLDVHVKRLRQKVEEDPHQPAHLITVRGLGYRFVE
jgi:two-component system, OmpR family, response regulator RegX3